MSVPYINYKQLEEFYTIKGTCELFEMSKSELKAACEKYNVQPRQNEIGAYGFVKYDICRLHNLYTTRGAIRLRMHGRTIRGHESLAERQGSCRAAPDQSGAGAAHDSEWRTGCAQGRAGISHPARRARSIRAAIACLMSKRAPESFGALSENYKCRLQT